jgi:hypothetical protein
VTPIRDRMQADLAAAMRARDARRTSVLRTTLSAVANAEAIEVPAGTTATEVPRRELTEDDIRLVVEGERADLEAVAAQLRDRGMHDEADDLAAKAEVLGAYLAQSAR